MITEEKRVGVFNLSKLGRGYDVAGFNQDETIRIAPNKTTEVPASVADFMLGKLPNGHQRYPDLVDAAKISPQATKAKDEALAENAKLVAENKALKDQLAEASKKDESTRRWGK